MVVVVVVVVAAMVTLCTGNVNARYHYHKGRKVNVSPPPSADAPAPSVPSTPADPPPASSPSVPSDPDPNNPGDTSDCIFYVTLYGAVGNGSSGDTVAFKEAWKAACAVESATTLVPSDKVSIISSTIFSGPCKPRLVFQVDGVLMPPEGPDCWLKADNREQWLVFYRLNDMKPTGKGIIEGNGHKWWELPCKPHRGPNGSSLPGP